MGTWCVSYVQDFSYLFGWKPEGEEGGNPFHNTFNEDISGWNVTGATNMGHMFFFARAFNQDVSKWDVSSVTNMDSMFYENLVFNQDDISSWDVSSVSNMQRMFFYSHAFSQDLCPWGPTLDDAVDVTNMFGYTTQLPVPECPDPCRDSARDFLLRLQVGSRSPVGR
jgi:surface protein